MLSLLMRSGSFAAPPPDLPKLKACIAEIETGGEPYPWGAVRVDLIPQKDGTLVETVSRGPYQVTETTLAHLLPGVHPSWLHHPVRGNEIMDQLLQRYISWYPVGTAKRWFYAHFAGINSKAYSWRAKAQLADRAVQCYERRLASR